MTEPQTDLPRRTTVSQLAYMLASRTPAQGQDSYNIGESAQGRAYVKDVSVYRREGETDEEFANRGLDLFDYLRANLPASENGAAK